MRSFVMKMRTTGLLFVGKPTDEYWKIFKLYFSRTRLTQGQPVSQAAADSSRRRQLQLLMKETEHNRSVLQTRYMDPGIFLSSV